MSIREYNFAVPGPGLRHIPGIPGEWPAGSIVSVDEDTNQVVNVQGLPPALHEPVSTEQEETPPALPEESVQQGG